ncbi:hypothetical protein CRENBAI_007961, partial [Crenichthys baileyi]
FQLIYENSHRTESMARSFINMDRERRMSDSSRSDAAAATEGFTDDSSIYRTLSMSKD